MARSQDGEAQTTPTSPTFDAGAPGASAGTPAPLGLRDRAAIFSAALDNPQAGLAMRNRLQPQGLLTQGGGQPGAPQSAGLLDNTHQAIGSTLRELFAREGVTAAPAGSGSAAYSAANHGLMVPGQSSAQAPVAAPSDPMALIRARLAALGLGPQSGPGPRVAAY